MRDMRRVLRRRVGKSMSWLMIVLMLCAQAQQAMALPSSPSVKNGDVKFFTVGDRLIVVQQSGKAIVNYGSFNIGGSETVRFIQPGSSAAILNRVTGGGASSIDGNLFANGRVYLINPNGILFGGGANVNVGSLVASAMNMSDGDFLSGNLFFSGGGGSVINNGSISAGRVYLVGGHVENNGRIGGGKVVLAAGQQSVLIDNAGGGEIRLVIDGQDGIFTSALDRVNYTQNIFDEAFSNNTRTVAGAGAAATAQEEAEEASDGLSAELSDLASQETMGGEEIIVPMDDSTDGGEIVIDTPVQPATGFVINRGQIDASGDSGGEVKLRGIRVGQNGEIHADGTVGNGGTVVMYGTEIVHVDDASTTTANAGLNGHGGAIVIFGEDAALIDTGSKIEVKGGQESGDGGFVEISGAQVEIGEYGDASAPNGKQGTLLIDPHNFWIDNLDTANIDFSDGLQAIVPTEDGSSGANIGDVIDVMQEYGGFVVDTHTGGSDPGNIYLQANLNFDGTPDPEAFILKAAGSIFIQNSIFDGSPGGDSLDIGLLADNAISITASINSGGGRIGLVANNGVTVSSSLTSGGGEIDIISKNSSVTINSSVNSGSGAMIISGDGNVNINSSVTSSGGDHSIYAGGNLNISGNVSSGGGEILAAAGNQVTINNAVNAGSARVTILGGNGVTQNSGGDITAGGDVAVAATNGFINMADGATTTSGGGDLLYFATTSADITGLNSGGGRTIVAASTITDAGNSSPDVRAFQALLAATNGSIGMNSANGLDIDVDELSAIATGSIRLEDSDNLTIGTFDQANFVIAGPTGVTYSFQIGPVSGLISTAGSELTARTLNGGLVVDAPVFLGGAGALTLDANGAGADLTINQIVGATNGSVSLRADDDVFQNNAVVGLGSITAQSEGGDIIMAGSQAVTFSVGGSVTYTAAQNIVSEEILTSNGSINVRAGNSVTQNSIIATVDGGSVLVQAGSGSIRMNSASNVLTVAGDGSITYTAAQNIVVQELITSNGSINVRAGGSVTQNATILTLDGGGVNVQAGSGSIRMNNASNVLTFAGDGTITYTAAQNIVVQELLTSNGSVNVRAGNSVTQEAVIASLAGGSVLVQAGTGSIRMNSQSNVLGVAGGNVTYTAAQNIVVSGGGLISTNGSVFVRAGNAVTQDAAILSTANGNVTVQSGSSSIRMTTNGVTAVFDGDILYTAATHIVTGPMLTSNGTINIRAGQNVTQEGAIASLGVGNVLVQSGQGSIFMVDATNVLTAVANGSLTYTAAQNIAINGKGLINTGGSVFVRAGNSVTQNSTIASVAGGIVHVQAGSGSIFMSSASNVLSVAGGSVTYTAQDNIVISGNGLISTNGSVFVRAGNAITQDAAILSTDNGDVLVQSRNSSIRMTTNGVTAVFDGDIFYTAAVHIVSGPMLTSNGNINVRAGQSITQEGAIASLGLGSVLVQAGQGSITMANVSNVLTAVANGSITYTAAQNIAINGKGLINTSGSIFVRAGNAVTQNAVIASVDNGNILVQSRNSSIRMTTNAVTAAGDGNITYTAAVDIVAQELITSNGNIFVRAGQSITQEAVFASLAGGDVLVHAANGDIFMVSNVLTLTGGGDIGYRAGDDMQIASLITTNGQITAIAGDSILQVSNIYNVGVGTIDVEAQTGSITMQTGTITAALAGNIRYAADGNIIVATIATTTDNVRVQSANGSILDDGGTLPNIIAVNAQLSAPNGGVGITGPGTNDPLETVISTLAGEAGSHSINLINLVPLTIDTVPPIDVNRVQPDGTPTVLAGTSLSGLTTTGGGHIVVLNASSMTVNQPVQAGEDGNILLATITGVTQNITLNSSVSSGSGDISLISGNSIIQNAAGDVSTFGGDVVALAIAGDIQMADGATTESHDGNIVYLATTNAILGGLDAHTGMVSVVTFQGSVLDGGDTHTDIVANAAQIISAGSIGTTSNGIETTVDTIAALTQDGPIKITESDDVVIGTVGPVNARIVTPDATTITTSIVAIAGLIVTNGGSILFDTVDGTITITNPVLDLAAGNIMIDANGAGKDVVISNFVVAANGHVSILADDSVLQYSSLAQTGTNRTIEVEAFTGSIWMAENAVTFGAGEVRYVAEEDVTLGSLISTSTNTVSVIANTGSILDGGDALQNIISLRTRLVAADGVGAEVDPLETLTGFLAARAGGGGIHIVNSSTIVIDTIPDVTVQRVNPDDSLTAITDPALSDLRTTDNGDIDLETVSGSIIVQDGDAPEDFYGIVADGSGEISLHAHGTNGNVIVNTGIRTATGDICILADNSVFINALDTAVQTGGKGAIAIQADADENNVGNFLQTAGVIHTETGNIYIAGYNVSQFGPSMIHSYDGSIILNAENNLTIGGVGGVQTENGDLVIGAGQITINSILAADKVALRATKGDIKGKGKVVSEEASLSARKNIGKSDQLFTVDTDKLATHTDLGDVFLHALGSVEAADVDGPRGLRAGVPDCAKEIPIPFIRDLSGITANDDMVLVVDINLSGNKVVAGHNADVKVDGSVTGLDLMEATRGNLDLRVGGDYYGDTIRAGQNIRATIGDDMDINKMQAGGDIDMKLGGNLTFNLMEADDIFVRSAKGSINMGRVNANDLARFEAGHAIHDNGSYIRAGRVILIAGEDIGDNSPIKMSVGRIVTIQAGGNIRIVQNKGGATPVGLISAGGRAEVSVPNGGLIDDNGSGLNIEAESASFNAQYLGTLADPLEVNIGSGNLEVDGAGLNGDDLPEDYIFVHLNGNVDLDNGKRVDYIGALPIPGLVILNGQVIGGDDALLREIYRHQAWMQEVPVIAMPEGVFGEPYFVDMTTPTREAWEIFIHHILRGQSEITTKDKELEKKATQKINVGPSAKLGN